MSGTVTVGGKPRGEFIRYVSGFVYQDDLFMSSLTVMEHLNFAVSLAVLIRLKNLEYFFNETFNKNF